MNQKLLKMACVLLCSMLACLTVQGQTQRTLPKAAKRIATNGLQKVQKHAESSYVPTLYGIVLNRYGNWTVSSFKPTAEAKFKSHFTSDDLDASGGCAFAQGKLYVNYYYEENFTPYTTQYVFDSNSWHLSETREMHFDLPTNNCSTYDPTTGQVFMQQPYTTESSITWNLMTMNLKSGEAKFVRYMSGDEALVCMAASADGVIYAINTNGMLETVNKTTGVVTKIGNTDVKPAETMQSAVIDPKTGKMYWACYTDEDECLLYEVNVATAKATLICKLPTEGSIPCLFMLDEPAPAEAPAAAEQLALESDGPALNGELKFNVPTTTQDGSVLSGPCSAYVTVAGTGQQMDVEPGQTYSVPFSIKSPDYVNATVYLNNAQGKSNLAAMDRWIGPDYPVAPGNLTLEKVEGTTNLRLSWDAPTEGMHGGYVNPDDIIYFIYGNEPSGVSRTWIEEYHGTEFIKDVKGASGNFMYQVRSSYMDMNGEIAKSNNLYYGNGLDAPCSLSFSNSDIFSRCTIIDANNDGKTWTRSDFGYAVNNSSPADDWLITEGINIEAGKRYKVTVSIGARNGQMYPTVCDLSMGKAATVEAQTMPIGNMTFNEMGFSKEFSYTIDVTESDVYYFGIHDVSTRNWESRLLSMKITEEAAFVAPDKVTDLVITPGEKGALNATINFKAPTTDLHGNALETIDYIEIMRGRDVITTVENPAPGSECTYVDNDAKQGDNAYTITAYNAQGGKGLEVKKTVWCGVDIPGTAKNVRLYAEGDILHLTWDAPTRGMNGRYIDPEQIDYIIMDTYYGNEIASVRGETHFEWHIDPNEPEQYSIDFAIGTSNVAGMSENVAYSNNVILGAPYALPFEEHFDGGYAHYLWFTMGGSDWDISNSTNGNGYTRFYAMFGGEGELVSGKIALDGAVNPMLHFDVMGYGEADVLSVKVADEFNGKYTTIKEINLKDLPAKQFVPFDVSLAEYADLPYIHVSFHGKGTHTDANIVMDNIEIRNQKDYDLAADDIRISNDEVHVGKEPVEVSLDIVNHGSLAASGNDYTVEFYAGERLFATVPGVDVAVNGKATVKADYAATTKDADKVVVYAVINYESDLVPEDNKSLGIEVYVFKPYLPTATDLAGVADGDIASLSWQAPDLSGSPVRTVFDDFESYRPFQINHFGDWTLTDVDKLPVTTTDWLYYPGDYEPMAYDIFNTDEITYYGKPLDKKWPAHSGKQFVMCMDAVFGDNDDWMITPQLSGNSQIVKFWAKSSSEEAGHEMIRFYYSTNSIDVKDFVALDTEITYVPSEWTEYSINVPEGAKYFAVRCVSHNRLALQIDDFTYEECAHPLEAEFVGYNVYCDGVLQNETPVNATYIEVPYVKDGVYTVCAVYDCGEAEATPGIVISATGIEQVELDGAAEYYDVAGRKTNKPSERLYIVKKNGVTKKVTR